MLRADKLLALLNRAGFAELEVGDWRGVLQIGGGLTRQLNQLAALNRQRVLQALE
jgi:hypothetical protein